MPRNRRAESPRAIPFSNTESPSMSTLRGNYRMRQVEPRSSVSSFIPNSNLLNAACVLTRPQKDACILAKCALLPLASTV
jgi:hypothetical protein